MRSYLSLIPISGKVHRKSNRMTLLCIIISVLLVTAIFSMADMSVRMEKTRILNRHGNWSVVLTNLTGEQSAALVENPDIKSASWYGKLNEDAKEDFSLNGRKLLVCGAQESYLRDMWDGILEGSFPKNGDEILLSENAKTLLNLKIGDQVVVETPGGEKNYRISGIGGDDSSYSNQDYMLCAFLDWEEFTRLRDEAEETEAQNQYFIQFARGESTEKAIEKIKSRYQIKENNIQENTALSAIEGESNSESVKTVYFTAAFLMVLIMAAGVLMISGSINSNVAQRTKFFGMLRCIGASRKQVMNFVKLEALNWCRTAIPIGVVLGSLISMGICAVLRYRVGGEFEEMPVFAVSATGILCGALVGTITVFLSAVSPAKRAAKVAPIEAVTDGCSTTAKAKHGVPFQRGKIQFVLGLHHAVENKKNLFLMTGSFALSIVLFLSFATGLDLAHALLPSLRSWQPDCSINAFENANSIEEHLPQRMGQLAGVKGVFANKYVGDMSAKTSQGEVKIQLVSYDDYLLNYAKSDIVEGKLEKIQEDGLEVLTIYSPDNPLKAGEQITIAGKELTVEGVLSDGLFADGITVICSEKLFNEIRENGGYALLGVQFERNASEQEIQAVMKLAGKENIVTDMREYNQETNGTYWAFRILVYSFLAIIALITFLNIMNSVSMSVSAKIKQYGAMRAVGMSDGQLKGMIAAEVFTYVCCGSLIGGVAGVLLNRGLYRGIITAHFGTAWHFPAAAVAVVLALVIFTAVFAIAIPTKRIQKMAITEVINEL